MTMIRPLFTALLFSVASITLQAETLLIYDFTRGKLQAELPGGGLYANAFSTGEGGLIGVSPVQEQCYLLMKSEEDRLPGSRDEAFQSIHHASFSITPVEGKSVTLRELSFALGAASLRFEGVLHGVVRVELGGEELEIPLLFSRDDQEVGAGYPIRRRDRREALPGRAVADLSTLPAPLNGPVTFRLFFYFTEGDLETLPSGTNYSIRIDDVTLTGELR